MGIIGNINQDQTTDQKKAKTKEDLVRGMNTSFQRLVFDFTSNFNLVWNNRLGLTPQQVFDALGADAASAFMVAGATSQLIAAISPTTVLPSPKFHYTINPDGTVTVGDAL